MNSTARQRFARLMQQEQAQQAQADMLAQMRGSRPTAPAMPARQGQASRMMGALRMAQGGAVGPLPSLQELSSFDYQYQDPSFGATAPFTQRNPIVPMFHIEAPAYGGMEQSVYDWTAPSIMGGQYTQPAREAPAMVESTSAYRPMDATTLPGGGANIPDVPVFPNQPMTPPVQTQPVAPPVQTQPMAPPVQTQPVVPPVQTQPMAPPVQTQPMAPPVQTQPVAPSQIPTVATTSTSVPNVITAEERQRREQEAAALLAQQAAEEEARVQAGILAEQQRQAALAEQERQQSIAQEAERLEAEEAERIRLNKVEADRLAEVLRQQAETKQKADEKARADADAKAKADADAKAASESAAAQYAQMRADDLFSRFGLDTGNRTPAPPEAEASNTVTWQQDVGGEGSMLATFTGTADERDRALGLGRYAPADQGG